MLKTNAFASEWVVASLVGLAVVFVLYLNAPASKSAADDPTTTHSSNSGGNTTSHRSPDRPAGATPNHTEDTGAAETRDDLRSAVDLADGKVGHGVIDARQTVPISTDADQCWARLGRTGVSRIRDDSPLGEWRAAWACLWNPRLAKSRSPTDFTKRLERHASNAADAFDPLFGLQGCSWKLASRLPRNEAPNELNRAIAIDCGAMSSRRTVLIGVRVGDEWRPVPLYKTLRTWFGSGGSRSIEVTFHHLRFTSAVASHRQALVVRFTLRDRLIEKWTGRDSDPELASYHQANTEVTFEAVVDSKGRLRSLMPAEIQRLEFDEPCDRPCAPEEADTRSHRRWLITYPGHGKIRRIPAGTSGETEVFDMGDSLVYTIHPSIPDRFAPK